jgi:hypothetical protein
MDDIDALCWYDVLPNGAPDLPTGALGPGFLGDIYVFSLTPASPSAGLFGGPAALSRAGGVPVITPAVLPPGFFGLLPTDNIDGLICHDNDSDFDAVPDWLDNCDVTPNAGQQDTDGDGIGDACDTEGPSPNANGLGGADDCFDGVDNNANGFTDAADPGCGDTDGDGIPDALDNCPTVPNPGQANVDLDAFGDVCDTEGSSPNTSGLGGADDCYDGVDNDGDGLTDIPDTNCGDTDTDGYTDSAEAGTPVCTDAVNDDNLDDATVNDGCPAVGAPEAGLACANALDDDGDGRVNDGCVMAGGLSEAAYSIGTSAAGPCSVGAVPDPSPSWPSDFVSGQVPNSTDRVNVYDIVSFIAPTRRLGTRPDAAPPPGSAFSPRWDLVPGRGIFPTWIAVTDITALLAGSSGFPPMFGGVRAFNGPACVGP